MPRLFRPISIPPLLVGDPVDTSRGAAVDQTLDFRLTGPLEFWWMRHYDSSLNHRWFACGWGHTHDLDRWLQFDVDGFRYQIPPGRVIGFPPVLKDGDTVSHQGYLLKRVSPACYQIFHHGEPAIEFEFQYLEMPARPKRLFRGKHEIAFAYDDAGRWNRIVDSAGRVIGVSEGPNGRILNLTLAGGVNQPDVSLVWYRYDERGNLVLTVDSSGHGFQCVYDEANRLVRRIGRKGFSFYFAYDTKGRCVQCTGDHRMHEVTLDYDPSGRITKVTRADGGVWSYIFDETGVLTNIVDPLGGIQAFLCDETGRLMSEVDPKGNETRVIYDAEGAPVAKVDSLGHRTPLPEDPNAPDPRVRRVAANPAEYEYGRLLDLKKMTMPDPAQAAALPIPAAARAFVITRPSDRAAVNGDPLAPKPLGPNWWPKPMQGRSFNILGKLVEQADDFAHVRRWGYDASGNVAEYEDFDGRKWLYDCGAWHLLLAETNPLGAQVRLSYTTSGEIASCTDPGGTVSEYGYDLKDNLIEVRRHGAIRDRYVRDPAGNLVAKLAGDGRVLLEFKIGPGNLPVERKLSSGDEHTFEYDKAGRHLVAATTKDAVAFQYDDLGNCTSEKRNGRGVERDFGAGRTALQSTLFERFTIGFERDANGKLVITDPGGKKHGVRCHPSGFVERWFSNGSQEVAQYDLLGRCLFKHAMRIRASAWSRRFHWSGEGELLRVQDSRNGETRHEYDAAHRLRRRIPGDGRVEDYDLDFADNLLRQPGLQATQDGNRLTSVNGLSVAYNERNHVALRQTEAGAVRYFYDSRDQLIRIESPRGLWEAAYDALGRRTRKCFGGQTTEFYWNGDQLIAEVRAGGQLRIYVYPDPVAMTPLLFLDYDSLDADPESCRRYFVYSDQIATPCLIEEESGGEVWRAGIQPYGRAEIASGAKIQFDLRFPGHYFDVETGLHYNRFRYYDPGLGRYLESDPWGIAGGYNLYAYRANPLLQVDVRGLGEEDKTQPGAPHPDCEATRRQLTPEEQEAANALVSITRGLAQNMIDNEDVGRGPVLTGVVDTRFPEDGPFFGQNTGIPDDLHPVLRARLDQHNQNIEDGLVSPSPTAGTPGDHSEINALDQALKNRDRRTGQQSTDDDLNDMIGHNVNLKNGSVANDDGTRTKIPAGTGCPPRCDNCRPITDGMTMVDQNGQPTDE